MLQVSQLPTFPENLLHLLCESATPNLALNRTVCKLRLQIPRRLRLRAAG